MDRLVRVCAYAALTIASISWPMRRCLHISHVDAPRVNWKGLQRQCDLRRTYKPFSFNVSALTTDSRTTEARVANSPAVLWATYWRELLAQGYQQALPRELPYIAWVAMRMRETANRDQCLRPVAFRTSQKATATLTDLRPRRLRHCWSAIACSRRMVINPATQRDDRCMFSESEAPIMPSGQVGKLRWRHSRPTSNDAGKVVVFTGRLVWTGGQSMFSAFRRTSHCSARFHQPTSWRRLRRKLMLYCHRAIRRRQVGNRLLASPCVLDRGVCWRRGRFTNSFLQAVTRLRDHPAQYQFTVQAVTCVSCHIGGNRYLHIGQL